MIKPNMGFGLEILSLAKSPRKSSSFNLEKQCQSGTSCFNRRNEEEQGEEQQETMGRNLIDNATVRYAKQNPVFSSQGVSSGEEYTYQTKQHLNQVVVDDNSEESGSNIKDHISLNSTPQMDKLILSSVLETNLECGAQIRDMMVEVDQSSLQHTTLIPEKPLIGPIEEHTRYNTKWKQRARHGPQSPNSLWLSIWKLDVPNRTKTFI